MSITIYKDSAANAIFIEDANGVQFLNSLQATVTNGACNIHDIARDINIVTEHTHTHTHTHKPANPHTHKPTPTHLGGQWSGGES